MPVQLPLHVIKSATVLFMLVYFTVPKQTKVSLQGRIQMTRTLPPILTANPLYRYTSHIYFCTPDNVHCLCTQ